MSEADGKAPPKLPKPLVPNPPTTQTKVTEVPVKPARTATPRSSSATAPKPAPATGSKVGAPAKPAKSSSGWRLSPDPTVSKEKQVHLRLVRVDVWSATKLAFFLALAFAIINVVATFVIMTVIHAAGFFNSVNDFVASIVGSSSVDVSQPFSTMTITGFAMLAGLVQVVLGSIFGALAAVVFNAIARIIGGLRVSFTNDK